MVINIEDLQWWYLHMKTILKPLFIVCRMFISQKPQRNTVQSISVMFTSIYSTRTVFHTCLNFLISVLSFKSYLFYPFSGSTRNDKREVRMWRGRTKMQILFKGVDIKKDGSEQEVKKLLKFLSHPKMCQLH